MGAPSPQATDFNAIAAASLDVWRDMAPNLRAEAKAAAVESFATAGITDSREMRAFVLGLSVGHHIGEIEAALRDETLLPYSVASYMAVIQHWDA